MFILTIAIIVLRAAVRALLGALFVLFTCFIDVYFMYIFLWTNKNDDDDDDDDDV